MKIQKNTNKRFSHKVKIILGISLALLVVGSGALLYAYQLNRDKADDTSVNLDKATDDEKKAGDDVKQRSATNDVAEEKNPASEIPPTPVPQAEGKSVVQVDITAANQNDSTLQVRSSIGTVTTTGSCTLRLTQGDTVFTKTSSVQALPSTSTCMGFDIPISELGNTGKWLIALRFENETLTGTATKEITIK